MSNAAQPAQRWPAWHPRAVRAATSSPASSPPSASQQAAATVRTAQATVAGKTETILVNSQGQPLYYYVSDTAAKSLVTGGLAAL